MTIQLTCPHCGQWFAVTEVEAAAWPCLHCRKETPAAGPLAAAGKGLTACRACGNGELYVQKDFPHSWGMGILIAALAVSCITYALHWIVLTWVVLIGSAAIDGGLYLAMGNVVICYRCQARHRGWPIPPALESFDLKIGERYRQERIRKEELAKRQTLRGK